MKLGLIDMTRRVVTRLGRVRWAGRSSQGRRHRSCKWRGIRGEGRSRTGGESRVNHRRLV